MARMYMADGTVRDCFIKDSKAVYVAIKILTSFEGFGF